MNIEDEPTLDEVAEDVRRRRRERREFDRTADELLHEHDRAQLAAMRADLADDGDDDPFSPAATRRYLDDLDRRDRARRREKRPLWGGANTSATARVQRRRR